MFALLAAVALAAPTEFETYELVILARGPAWTAEVSPEVEALQAQHLGYLDAMKQAGHLVVAGPLSESVNPDMRGVCLYRTGSLEEARALAEADPAVQAGRLRVDVMTWWTEPGALGLPRPVHGAHGAHGDDATVHTRFEDPARWAARFDDPARDAWQKPAELVAALGIPRGAVVADVGAGTGYLEAHLAKAVGKKGKVIAVDIEPTLVAHLARRALSEGRMQVDPRVGTPDDPALGRDEVDIVVFLDTYHHVDDRIAYFTRLRDAVRAGGRLVVVDFVPDRDLPVGPPPAHRIGPDQVEAELAEAGWSLAAAPEVLPYQFVRVFAERL